MAVFFLFALSALFLTFEVYGDGDSFKKDTIVNPLDILREMIMKLEKSKSESLHLQHIGKRSTRGNNIRCGGLLDAQSSVNYLKSHDGYGVTDYENHLYCYWIIEAPPSRRIHIRASNIELEDSENCAYDFLKISYKNGTDYPLWRKICGNQDLVEFTSPENVIGVTFRTDATNTYGGFQISYELS